jgi:hypothetical protein
MFLSYNENYLKLPTQEQFAKISDFDAKVVVLVIKENLTQ